VGVRSVQYGGEKTLNAMDTRREGGKGEIERKERNQDNPSVVAIGKRRIRIITRGVAHKE